MENGEIKCVFIEGKGFIQIAFDKEGNQQKMLLLESELAKQFSAFALIKKDIDLVKEALNTLKNGAENPIVKQSLSFYAIVTYAKCFTSSNGRKTTLNFKDVFKHASDKVKNDHEVIMEQRHDYVAHAGDKYESCPVTATLLINEGVKADPRYTKLGLKITPHILFLKDIDSQIDDFLNVCSVVDDYVIKKLKIIHSKLKQETFDRGFLELGKMAFLPDLKKMVRLTSKQ